MRALEELNYLGALDDDGGMTDIGRAMADLPLEPQLSAALLAAPRFSCSEEVLSIIALLSVQQVFTRPKDAARAADEAKKNFAHDDGDHLTLLNAYHAYKGEAAKGGDMARWCWDNFVDARALGSADSVREQVSGRARARGGE